MVDEESAVHPRGVDRALRGDESAGPLLDADLWKGIDWLVDCIGALVHTSVKGEGAVTEKTSLKAACLKA